MELKPDFLLSANDSDVTSTIRERLVSLTYTDQTGLSSDELEIVLADPDPDRPVRLPAMGAELRLAIGYAGDLRPAGMFVVDGVKLGGWPTKMTIVAHAAIQQGTPAGKTTLRTQKTREWAEGTTLGDMLSQITGDHGLTSAIPERLAAIALPHVTQIDESDLHFLLRLTRKYGAVLKPADGRLVLAMPGEARGGSGVRMPTISLRPGDVAGWSFDLSCREAAGTVLAHWHDVTDAATQEVREGDGEPVTRLKMYYATVGEARSAAKSEWDRRRRGRTSLTLSMPGNPQVVAECCIHLTGFHEGVDGDWVVTEAKHVLDPYNGFATTVRAERPAMPGDMTSGSKGGVDADDGDAVRDKATDGE